MQVFVAALLQASLACPPGDLAFHKPVQGDQLRGFPGVVADGNLAFEGSWWDQPAFTVVLTTPQAFLLIDLQQDTEVRALVLQGDNNDVYHVEASLDGASWREIWAARPLVDKMGLRTRWIQLPGPQAAHYLRVRGTDGDGFFSVAEVRAYCQVPSEWPPKLVAPPPLRWWNPAVLWHAIDNDVMVAIKGTLAGLGTILLIWGWWLRRRGQPDAHKKLRDYLLGGMGVFSLLCWWNLFHYHFDGYLHVWEHYHYYIGAKYFRELGYTRLYQCTAAADIEQGYGQRVAHRQIRSLVTNHLEPSDAIVADPTLCTRHFSQKRWEQFKADIGFFRSQFSLDRWDESQHDHGYNGTPVWGIMGSALANLAPPGKPILGTRYINILGLVDSLLLLGMWGVVMWAFGWRATCVALLYWGTDFPARYWWNGGALLRMDWLFWSVVGICLVKKNKLAGGGAALTYGALLRIFPGFIVVGIVVKAAARMVRERRWVLSKEHWQFAKGCIAAMAILLPLSAAVAGGGHRLGLDAWFGLKADDGSVIEQGFVQNSAKHLKTPLTNNMGLKTVVAYRHDQRARLTRNYSLSDPFEKWKDERNGAFERRKILFALMVVGFLVLLAWATEKTEDWVALCLGAGLIPVATELTCYYYSFALVFGLLWVKREELGIWTLALSAATCAIPSIWRWDDESYTWMSLCYVAFAIGAAIYVGRLEHAATQTEETPVGKAAPSGV